MKKPMPVTARVASLGTGEVGFMVAAIKDLHDVRIGDTVTDARNPAAEALPGYKPSQQMVYCDFYPSGELLFQTGAGSNSGSYSDKKNDALIKDTNFGDATLASWQNYLVTQLPVFWQPNQAAQLTEIRKNLKGVVPQNPLQSINPENWFFTQ